MATNGQQLATREQAQAPVSASSSKANTLRSMLEKMLPQIKLALPRHMTAERMLRVTMTAVQRTPDLMQCDPMSVVGAVVQASQLGLEPDGVLGHAYLVPFNNRKTGRKECQLIAGYKGLIDLARRSGQVVSISAHVAYERDKFVFEYGTAEKLEHTPHMGKDRGNPVCAYAVAKLRDDAYALDVMSVAEINAIRDGSKAGQSGPWQTHWSEMARKTVIRRLVKYLPLSPELQKAVTLDELADAGVAQSLDLEVESNEVVAEATAGRQAALREKYTANNDDADQNTYAEDTDEPECGCPEAPAGKHENGCSLAPVAETKQQPKRRETHPTAAHGELV